MAWVAVDSNLKDCKKIKRLVKALDIGRYEAMGRLVALWGWGQRNAEETGLLSDCDAEDIAEAFGWEGKPEALISALVDAGFMERGPAGLILHDWEEWQGPWYEAKGKREYNKLKQRQYRAEKRLGVPACNTRSNTRYSTQSNTTKDTNVPLTQQYNTQPNSNPTRLLRQAENARGARGISSMFEGATREPTPQEIEAAASACIEFHGACKSGVKDFIPAWLRFYPPDMIRAGFKAAYYAGRIPLECKMLLDQLAGEGVNDPAAVDEWIKRNGYESEE